MNEIATKEERLMVQVAQLQKLLSEAEFARDRWRKSARRLYDSIRLIEHGADKTGVSISKNLFEETYRWENQS